MVSRKSLRTIRCLAFVIPVLVVLIGMMLGSFAPFGEKDVMSAGGMSDRLTFYYELHDRVHEGEGLLYSLTSGMGYDFTKAFSYYLTDPLNLIILLFPRTAILTVINLMYALKIGLAGLLMSVFLTHRKKGILSRRERMEVNRKDDIAEIAKRELIKRKEKERKGQKELQLGSSEMPKSRFGKFVYSLDLPNLGFSIAFALSAYMVGQGLDVSHVTVVALFPAILMALDNLLEKGKWKLYTALMAVSIFCSFYMTIIVFVFSILYTAAYEHENLNKAIHGVLLKLMSDMLAVGAGAVIIINVVSSGFFQREISMKFPLNGVSTTVFDVVKAQMPGTPPSSVLTYGYGIDIFCGTASLLLLIFYLLNPNISRGRKIRQSIVLSILTMAFIFVMPNHLFNGFFTSRANLCVFGFLFVFQLILMAYEAFLNLEHNASWQIHLGTIAFFITVIASTFLCDRFDSMTPFLIGLEIVIVYYILFLLYRNHNMTNRLFYIVFSLMMVGEISYTFVKDFSVLGNKSEDYYESADYKVYETAKEIQRGEPHARVLYYDPKTSMSTPVSNTLCGYDYIITSEKTTQVDSLLEYVRTENGLAVYKNPYIADGFFLPKSIDKWIYEPETPFSSINLLIRDVLGSTPIFQSVDGEFMMAAQGVLDEKRKERIREAIYAYSLTTDDNGDLYGSVENIVHFGNVQPSGEANIFRLHWDREQISISPTKEYASFNREAFLSFYNTLNKAESVRISSSEYLISINAPEDGYLVVPVSPERGWSADGYTLTSKELPGGDFLMVPVTAGAHEVSLSYSPILLYTGLIISVVFAALLIVLLVSKKTNKVKIPSYSPRLTGFIQENYVYFLTFGILTIVFVVALCASSSFPFGDRSPLIGDGYEQAYNGYRGMISDIKNGNYSILNWNTGVAIDRYGSYASNLTHPWSLLKYYLIPDSMIFIDYIFSRFLSFVFPGLCIILYLTHKRRGAVLKKTDWRLVAVGTAYSLSSYSIAYFLYGGFGFFEILPLVLLGMERLIYDKKPILYILILFSFMGDAYYAFMLCEFIFLYFFTMEFDGIKDMFFKGLRILISSLASVGLACYLLLPYFFRTLASPYKTADTVSPISRGNGSYLSVFSDTMSFRQPTILSENDYDSNIYVGILLLLCIPLYLMNKKIRLSVRIRRILLVALLFIGFGNNILNFVFHGFHYQSLVPNRFAAFYIFMLVIMFCDCLAEWKDYNSRTFAFGIGGAALCAGILWTVAFLTGQDIKKGIQEGENVYSLYVSLFLLGLYLTIALLQLWKKHRSTLRNTMIAILLLEVICSSFVGFKKSVGMNEPYTKESAYINSLADRQPEMGSPFHATEYIESELYNMAEVTNTTSISAFSSMMSQAHLNLVRKWGLLTSNNLIYYYSGNPVADMMLHIDYHITSEMNAKSISSYPVIDSEGTLRLHENPWYLPVGIFIPDVEGVRLWNDRNYRDYDFSGIEYQNAFSGYMGCGDIYEELDMEKDQSKITEDKQDSVNYILLDPTDYEAGKGNEVYAKLHLAKDVKGDIFISYNGAVMYVGQAEEGKVNEINATMHLPKEQKEYSVQVAVLNREEMSKLHDVLSKNTMDDARTSGGSLEGTITAPENGMLYLSVPEMSEWVATVDGEEVEIVPFLGGTGIPVTKGTHTIRLSFHLHGVWVAIGISIGTLVLLILYVCLSSKRKKEEGKD